MTVPFTMWGMRSQCPESREQNNVYQRWGRKAEGLVNEQRFKGRRDQSCWAGPPSCPIHTISNLLAQPRSHILSSGLEGSLDPSLPALSPIPRPKPDHTVVHQRILVSLWNFACLHHTQSSGVALVAQTVCQPSQSIQWPRSWPPRLSSLPGTARVAYLTHQSNRSSQVYTI